MKNLLITIAAVLALVCTACAPDESSASADRIDTDTPADVDQSETNGEGESGDAEDPEDPDTSTAIADAEDPDDTPDPVLRRGRLQAFDACDAFLDHMQTEAGERVTAFGLGGGPWGGGPGVLEAEILEEAAVDFASDAVADSAGAPAPSVATTSEAVAQSSDGDAIGGAEFSTTNNQVGGVDEPDIVKTDGRRIVTVSNQRLSIFNIESGTAELDTTLDLSVYPRDILLTGDRVLVLGEDWGPVTVEPFDAEASLSSEPFSPIGGPVTIAVQIDIADDATEVSTLRIEGSYVSARRIGETVRLVVSSPPPSLDFIYPSGPGSEDIAAETNKRIVEDSQLSDWLSEYSLSRGGEVLESGPVAPCNRIYRPSEFSGFGVLSVLTVDMAAEQLSSGNGTAVVTQGQSIYASDQSLYVATAIVPDVVIDEPFSPTEDFEQDFSTSLHRFDISDPTTANYVASGSAPGSMLSQFSMHEWDNRLFVATTEGSPWGFSENSVSGITVLEADGDDLVEVGSVSDMGRGERIFSVRFVEDTAYVVTFRQVDPLYVVDLSDPNNPEIQGELKIPGFSTYLHPIGNGRLIGVGQDATDEGRTLGVKVSLFDVSDPSNPTEQATWVLENGYSPVEYDHRAFLWWAERDLAVLPASSWETAFNGAVLLQITTDGIVEVGRIDHTPDPVSDEDATTCEAIPMRVDYFGPGTTGNVCRPGDTLPRQDYCDIFTAGDFARGLSQELGLEDVQLGDGEEFWLCFPEYGGGAPEIMRTLIVGDSLWSISWEYLQANQLDTLERTDRDDLN